MITVRSIHEDVRLDTTAGMTAGQIGNLLREHADGPEAIAQMLDRVLNSYGSMLARGQKMGLCLTTTHRALQANAIKFLIGALYQLSKAGTDPRNEYEVKLARLMIAPVMDTIESFLTPNELLQTK